MKCYNIKSEKLGLENLSVIKLKNNIGNQIYFNKITKLINYKIEKLEKKLKKWNFLYLFYLYIIFIIYEKHFN